MGSSKNAASDAAAQQRADEQARQERIRTGTASINKTLDNQFTSDFYDRMRRNYDDYALPQLDKQYADAQKELTFSLTRQGLLNSSARAAKEAELQTAYDTNKATIANNALSYVNSSKSNVEDARANLISQLNVTGDAEQASSSALGRAQALSQPQAYSTLGDLFSGFTATLSKYYAAQLSALKPEGETQAPSEVRNYSTVHNVVNGG